MLTIRAQIFEIAASDSRIGRIEECLKWGQPAYLTVSPKSGTTIRLGVSKTGGFGVYTHCQSSVMSDIAALGSDSLRFDGNRGVIFAPGETPDPNVLSLLIRRALTYHLS